MAEKPARRRHQHDLAALPLLQHRDGRRLRHEPALCDVGVHHVEKARRRHLVDLRDVILARCNDENVHPAETADGGRNDRRTAVLRGRTGIDPLHLGTQRLAVLATASSSLAFPALSTSLHPAPASTFAASAPKAPDAPVMTATLPFTSKSESGFFSQSSVMASLQADRG